jgi:hypothetical protein
MSHIFIAHVEEDAEVALKIARGLEEAGYATWCYEVDSVPGPSYIVRTGESVAQSQAVIVVISPHSLGSSQVTKEVVRAHESDKRFIPILRDITHAEFQQRQPEWREAIGSATSIRIPPDGVEAVIPLIIEGVRLLGIERNARVDEKRISRISKALDDIHNLPVSQRSKITPPVKAVKKSRKPLVITLASMIVIVIVVVVVFSLQGSKKDKDHGITSNLTSSTPLVTGTTTPTTAPKTSVPSSAVTTLGLIRLPDLVIQDITWSPKSPALGTDVTFTITITNQGKADAGYCHVASYIDDKFRDTVMTNPFYSGETQTVAFTWKAELGAHAIKAIVDFNDTVTESDENNNQKIISFSAASAPDLIIQDITLTPANPSAGESIVFTVTVKNQGNGAAGQFSVYFYINGFECNVQYNIDILYAGQTTTAIFTCTTSNGGYQNLSGGPLRPGTFIFKAVADGGNAVSESEETNNSKSVTFTVR